MENKYFDILEKNSDLLNLFGLKLNNLGNSIYLTGDKESTLFNLKVSEFQHCTVLNATSNKETLDIEIINIDDNSIYISLSNFLYSEYALRSRDVLNIELVSNNQTLRASITISPNSFEYKYKDSNRTIQFKYNDKLDSRYTNIISFNSKNIEKNALGEDDEVEEYQYKLFIKNSKLYISNNNTVIEIPSLLREKYVHDYFNNRYTMEDFNFVINCLSTNCPNIISFLKEYSIFNKINSSKYNPSIRQRLYLAFAKKHFEHKKTSNGKTLKKGKK